jgi:MFS transporter, ACS family, hexuronate transporter
LETTLIRSGQEASFRAQQQGWHRLVALIRNHEFWGIVLGRALTDPIWWFYVFWLPQYLSDARGFSLKQIALFSWIPFAAADLGNFTGGLISGYCIRKGIPVVRARLGVCLASCIPILAGIPAARVHSVYAAMAFICLALWGYASWSTMGLTLPSDLFPHDVVATVTGFSGLAAGIVSTFFTFAVGYTVDRFSYRPAFLAAGLLPVLATICLFLLIRSGRGSIPESATENQSAPS